MMALNQLNYMTKVISRPIDSQSIPSFVDPLQPETNINNSLQSLLSPIMGLEDPAASVNAATTDAICYGCRERGYLKANCRSPNPERVEHKFHCVHSDICDSYLNSQIERRHY